MRRRIAQCVGAALPGKRGRGWNGGWMP